MAEVVRFLDRSRRDGGAPHDRRSTTCPSPRRPPGRCRPSCRPGADPRRGAPAGPLVRHPRWSACRAAPTPTGAPDRHRGARPRAGRRGHRAGAPGRPQPGLAGATGRLSERHPDATRGHTALAPPAPRRSRQPRPPRRARSCGPSSTPTCGSRAPTRRPPSSCSPLPSSRRAPPTTSSGAASRTLGCCRSRRSGRPDGELHLSLPAPGVGSTGRRRPAPARARRIVVPDRRAGLTWTSTRCTATIVETSPDGIWVIDLDGRTIYANQAISDFLRGPARRDRPAPRP